jgi:redox-sensitive bicupin YhaK (pirin superfamily)
MTVDVRRGSARFLTQEDGRSTRHSFSFGAHYDPDNLGFGPMVCHDDHLLRPGVGFVDHPHRDVEVVTWVISGGLVHAASVGTPATLRPGQVQVMSAGEGVTHAEVADAEAGATRFIQVWLRPDRPGTEPSFGRAEVELVPGTLRLLVSGHDDAAPLQIGTASASLRAARLAAGDAVTLPDDPLQHVFVATGSLARSSLAEPLQAGDAFRITDEPGLTVTAASPSELLVWSFRD